MCASGKSKSAWGYHWCYIEDLDSYVIPIKKVDTGGIRKVKCIELNLIFNCVADASEYLGKPRRSDNISSCARGERSTAWGYHWEYITEEQEQKEAI